MLMFGLLMCHRVRVAGAWKGWMFKKMSENTGRLDKTVGRERLRVSTGGIEERVLRRGVAACRSNSRDFAGVGGGLSERWKQLERVQRRSPGRT